MTIISPSILSCDWGNFSKEIKDVTKAGADWLHLDIMDGNFVPPITFGEGIVKIAKKSTSIPLDVHLMINNPENHIDSFSKAGSDYITVHIEATNHVHRLIQQIKENNVKAGISLNPGTPISAIEEIIEEVDLILVMSVNPGWGGQKFIKNSLKKIKSISKLIKKTKKPIILEVDGGVNQTTSKEIIKKGATALVSGSYIFHSKDYKQAIDSLRK